MDDAAGLAEALLGLEGFRILEVRESPDDVCITLATGVHVAACGGWPRTTEASTPGTYRFSRSRPAHLDEAPLAVCPDPDCEERT
jgi:hypothetical protein